MVVKVFSKFTDFFDTIFNNKINKTGCYSKMLYCSFVYD